MFRVGQASAMCEEARALILGYLDSLEEYDRLQLIFLAAYRRNDNETLEGHRSLLHEAKVTLRAARERFKEHQKSHNCSHAINFGEDL
jgi:hypothetical protein